MIVDVNRGVSMMILASAWFAVKNDFGRPWCRCDRDQLKTFWSQEATPMSAKRPAESLSNAEKSNE